MSSRLLGIGLVLALGVAAALAIGWTGAGAARPASEGPPAPAQRDLSSGPRVVSSAVRVEGTPQRDTVEPGPLAAGPVTLRAEDVVRARDTLDGGRQAALAELRRVAEASCDSLQQSAQVLALQAKLLKYEHSLVLLAEGGYRFPPSGRPVQRRSGHEYLIMHSFVRAGDAAHDLLFDFDLAAERFTDLRVTIEDQRVVERRAEIEVVHRFNARTEAERRVALEGHASATRGHSELMQSIAQLAPADHQQRELLGTEAARLSGQMLPWHFIITPGSTTVRSRLADD
jgi:hypothetical protein